MSFVNSNKTIKLIPDSSKKIDVKLKKKHLSGNLTLSGGCIIHYEVDVEYQLLPPKILSYHGTLTFSGNCTGSQTFRGEPTCDENGAIIDLNVDESEYEFSKELKDAMKIVLLDAYL